MPLAPTTGAPVRIQAGDTHSFLLGYTDFPVGSYTLTFVITQGTSAPVSTVATTSGSSFLVTLSAAVTANLAAGMAQWVAYASATGIRYQADAGVLQVLPNLATTLTPTFAQAQLTRLQTVLAEFTGTTKKKVEFQGQMFERAEIASYREDYKFWKAQVLAEQAALNGVLGGPDNGRIAIRFA